MSASSKINESPSHFMVLEAIARGMDSIDKISSAVRKGKDEVSSIVNDLVTQRLATMVEKRRFFVSKKVKITITETGKNLLGIKHGELEQNKQKLQQLYESGDKQQLQTQMDSSRMWMPFMLFSGIMNVLFFTSMISFMGMTMNPSESAAVDNSGSSTDASDSGGTDNQADAGASDATDTGGMGSEGGGFDGGGFDGGGFEF
ncbi:MAG: MarR family transcriptional regulator [Thermoproteota archaeon]|nr:MarR family transcriptional regulator [Thermoproteota archaeon]